MFLSNKLGTGPKGVFNLKMSHSWFTHYFYKESVTKLCAVLSS